MIENLNYPGDLTDVEALAHRLARTGLSPVACREKARLFHRAAAALHADRAAAARANSALSAELPGPANRPIAFFVPGRIEVLGKHTDYAGGSSMVTATERGFAIVGLPRGDDRVHVTDAVAGQAAQFRLDPELVPTLGHWSNYPMTVARRLARNFPGARRGADLAFASDLPPAAGMSSSSALMVAVFLALDSMAGMSGSDAFRSNIHNLTDLAGYLGTVENGQTFGTLAGDRGVGTFGGSEDHTAMLCARPGQVSQYAYRPVRLERMLAVPKDHVFAVGASGVVAEKTGDAREKYNQASRLIAALEELWWRDAGAQRRPLAEVLVGVPGAADRLTELADSAAVIGTAPGALVTRLCHFIVENQEVIPRAGDALAAGDVAGFGRAVDQSQRGAEELLGNQVPATCYLAASARKHGAAAASAFGAGFGGSVWALVSLAQMDPFLAAWSNDYRQRFPEHTAAATFFATAAGPAAFRVG